MAFLFEHGYVDFERLFLLHSVGAFFIIRAKSDTRYERRYSHPVDKTSGVRCDQTVVLTGAKRRKHYSQPLKPRGERRILDRRHPRELRALVQFRALRHREYDCIRA